MHTEFLDKSCKLIMASRKKNLNNGIILANHGKLKNKKSIHTVWQKNFSEKLNMKIR